MFFIRKEAFLFISMIIYLVAYQIKIIFAP